MVHWILTAADRRTDWLSDIFHARYREVLLHTCCRYHLFCPVYSLMPDHLHLIWIGIHEDADQRNAMKHFRRHLGSLLVPAELQKQAYDNVLREEDREREAFQRACFYILENPVRAKLADTASAWPYSGSMVPGYPEYSPHRAGFWDAFWKMYANHTRANIQATFGE